MTTKEKKNGKEEEERVRATEIERTMNKNTLIERNVFRLLK